ncbi:MAG: hypothetical protein ABSG62_23015 [Terracidiphilus sp.]|jgi:hypothetical protein
MKVLVDNGIVSASSILVPAEHHQMLRWGTGVTTSTIVGFKRAELAKDPDQQTEKDALFTIGRLARAGSITLFTYSELRAEDWRRSHGAERTLNALSGCKLQQCPSAVERSKFQSTINMQEWFAKGGEKDRDNGSTLSEFNQIPYFEWLKFLTQADVTALVNYADKLRLDDFELDSLQDLSWFQSLSRALITSEDLPDCFHIWTARRNKLDVFLTMEKKLPRVIKQLNERKVKVVDLSVAVLRPTHLLRLLGVTEFDEVPVAPDRFYSVMEVLNINQRLLES